MTSIRTLFSGSSGNSTLINNTSRLLLLDAGVSASSLIRAVTALGQNTENIEALILTHEHTDHVAGVKVLSKKLPRMEIYASAGTALYFKDVPELYSRIRVISEGETVELCGLTVMPFKTSHDALESFGYVICSEGKKLFGFATDTGCVTENIYEALKGAKVCVLESNHDEGMLMCGPYPYYLKRRILSDRGHLSNTDCASLAESLYKDGTQRFVLAHLSAENNMPELAFETVKAAVRYADVSVAPRKNASEEFYA